MRSVTVKVNVIFVLTKMKEKVIIGAKLIR